MPIKKTRLAQGETTNNGGTPTVSAWDYPFDMTPEEQAELDALAAEESAIYSNGAAMMAVVMAEWKAARERHPAFEVAVMTSTGGALTKGYDRAEDDTIATKPGGKMNNGSARRTQVNAWDELAGLINAMKSNEALTLGRLRRELPKWVGVTTKNRLTATRLAAAQPGGFNQNTTYITRTAEYFCYEPGQPAPLLLDHDAKGMPEAVKARIEALGGFWPALCSVMPGLVGAARIERCSTSTGITRTDTGFMLPGGGLHVYLLIADGADAHRFLYDLHKRMWLAGFGYYGLGKSGQLLDRSIVDRMVHGPERLVFEGAPVLGEGLHQDKTARMAVAHDGAVLDTREACPSLSVAERAKLNC